MNDREQRAELARENQLRRQKRDAELAEKIRRYKAEGLNHTEIGQLLGLSSTCVSKRARALGAP